MSWKSMGREATGCDFPGCNKGFDMTKGALVAIVRPSGINAYCREHCDMLTREGVILRTIDEIHTTKQLPVKAAHDRAFIEGLKRAQQR